MGKVLLVTLLSLTAYLYFTIDFMLFAHYEPALSNDVRTTQITVPSLKILYKEIQSTNCHTHKNCSWEQFEDNEAFLFKHAGNEGFYKEAVEEYFREGQDLPFCVPRSFGYRDEDADVVFPKTKFERCGEKKEIIWIDEEKEELRMSCDGEYFLGEDRSEELMGFDVYKGKAQRYKGPVKLTKEVEWAYGTCKGKRTEVEGATYRHFNDRGLYKQVQDKMQEIQTQQNSLYNSSENTNPITAIFLSIDSLSRNLFYRRLPKTYEFLKSLNADSHRIFDFKLNNVFGDNSIPNVFPVLTGNPVHFSGESWKHKNQVKKKDLIKDTAIWTYLKENGWATMFATEFCDNYFTQQLGRKPNVDHLTTKFWCAAQQLSGFSDSIEAQRCIGNKNSHYYILNYTNSYVENYQGINKWAHVVVVSSHENSGTVINSLDEDLEKFLRRLLGTRDDLMLFILGDHGPRYGNWKKTLDGAQEHKLTSLILVASTGLLKRTPFSFDILNYNTNRLITKTDLYKTMQHIGLLPYYTKFQTGCEQDKKWESGRFETFSLLLDKIPSTRTCEDALIHKTICPCNEYEEVRMEKQSKENQEFIKKIAEAAIDQINEEAMTSFNAVGYDLCQKVSLKKIVRIDWFRIRRCKHEYRFVLEVNEDSNAVVEAEVFVQCTGTSLRAPKFSYQPRTVYLNGKMYYKVNYVKRIDENSCKKHALDWGISPDVCFCRK